MFTAHSAILPMLVEELRASLPNVAELLDLLAAETSLDQRRAYLRQLGALWYHQNGEPEVLAEFGMGLAEQFSIEPGVTLAELLMAYGAAREEKRTSAWENNLVRRMAELSGLHRVISAANSTLDLDTSMQMVVETVAEVIGVEACSVYLYDKNSDDLTLRATRGLNAAAIGQVRIGLGEGVTGAAARDGRPIAVADIYREARFQHEPMLGEESFRSILAVPIVLFSAERFHVGADKLQGVITIQTNGPRDFSPEEVNFVETVAGELAFFIVNAQLYQQTGDQLHQKVQELTTLQQVSKRIAEQLDLQEVLRMIVAKAVELARVDRADIFRCGEDDQLELAASQGGSHGNRVLDFIAQAVREGRPLAVLNAYTDSRFPDRALVAASEGFHSLFCMPLRVQQNRIIGAICLYTHEARHFDYEQVRLLSTFADEAAIAIENARLYDESQTALRIKSAMLQEMHHRVRNNLQTISALLAMQQRRLDPGGKGAEALRDSVARIQAIAGVHNLLCREDVGVTTIDAVVRQIVDSAQVSLANPERPILFQICGEPARVASREATVLAIVLNELIVNSMSHGLTVEGGNVIVETIREPGAILVEVRDDGPSHGPAEASTSNSGLGLQIIRTLVNEDLSGEFELQQRDGWMCARVRFPQRGEVLAA
ncbi:histidine kinase [Kouleothrix aurantiaca]|uniref:histidine kinase n=1 Tax=Kouleothrix aurantiaca TaxID=186479 RepID=A0A0P9D002_9CHLR|nr:histidine kinase [Kouleothrix aurantiaca]